MDDFKQRIVEQARMRISHLFQINEDSLSMEARFDQDLKATFVSKFRENEFDQIDHDIKDVADWKILKELTSGELVIQTVGDYCSHMVRCYHTRPDEVLRVLQLERR